MNSPTIYSSHLPYPCDCVDIFNNKNKPSIIAVGLYNYINEEEGKINEISRIGGIQFFKILTKKNQNFPTKETQQIIVEPLNCLYTKFGVLDLKCLNSSMNDGETNELTCICSDCSLRFIQIEDKPTSSSINDNPTHVITNTISSPNRRVEPNTIGVALDVFEEDGRCCAFCCSDGMAYIVRDKQHITNEWRSHDIETWTIAFDPFKGSNVVSTGADDCCLKIWDIRTDMSAAVATNKKEHTMGVTALHYSPTVQHRLYSGSYDENIRIWDTRLLRHPVNTLKTSGGIWRIKCFDDMLFVAACHGGAEVWSTSSDATQPFCMHTQHTSMVYGICGWHPTYMDSNGDRQSTKQNSSHQPNNIYGVSCSFYDKLLHVWDTKDESNS